MVFRVDVISNFNKTQKQVPLRAEKTSQRRGWARLYSFEYKILFSDPELIGNESQRKDTVISSFKKPSMNNVVIHRFMCVFQRSR